MTNIRSAVKILSIFLTLSTAACEAGEASAERTASFPASMIGTWQVTDVLTDRNDTDQGLDARYITPKYLGRVITLTSDQFSINTYYDNPCEKASLISHKMTASELVAKSISTRLFSPTRPTPEDMKLPLSGKNPVDALYLSCSGKLLSKDKGMVPTEDLSNVVWFVDLENGKLAMSWHEQTVLILNRLTESSKPVASFNCAKAGTTVEKTICNSVGLAAYDKSLGQTYKQARDYYRSQNDTAAVGELSDSQKTWIKERDNCGDDAKCLEETMGRRVGDIIYDLGDYMYQHR